MAIVLVWPHAKQIWNIYRSRAIGYWLQSNRILVIPNIRYGDNRTYSFCCDGVSKGCIISVGTHGTIKDFEDRTVLVNGLDYVINKLKPSAIIIYGSCPDYIFSKYKNKRISIIHFEPDFYRQLSLDLEVD